VKAQVMCLRQILTQDTTVTNVSPGTMYRNAGILNRGRGLFRKPDLAGEDTSYKTLSSLRANQVVYSKLFGWEGAVTTVPEEFDGFYVSAEFPHFTISPDVSVSYLDHYLKSPTFMHQLATAGTGLGQRRQRVNVGPFVDLAVPIPSRPDQDRIAAYLDSLARPSAEAEATVARAHDLLTSLRGRVFRHLSESQTVRIGEIVTQVDQLEDVSSDTEYPMLGVRSYGRGAFSSGTMLGSNTAYKKLRQFKMGQICYPKLMAWQGALAVVPESLDLHYASPEFVGFEVNSKVASVRYLAHCLAWPTFLSEATLRSSGTNANRRRLQPKDFLDIAIPLPPMEAQIKVARMLDTALEASATTHQLANYATAILPASRSEIFANLEVRLRHAESKNERFMPNT